MSVDIVNDIEPRVQYTALAAQTDFDYPFPIFADGDLVVDVDGVTQALTTDYTVTGEGEDAGGTVTFLAAMTGGEVVTIYRDLPIERTTDFQQNGRFSSAAFNDELDRLVMVQQQLDAAIGRALRVPQADATASADMELPSVLNRAEKYLYFNAAGDPEAVTAVAANQVFSRSTIGTALYTDQTAAELAAGVTPSNPYFPEFDVRRYGADPTGATDSSAAIQACLNVGGPVYLPKGTYDIGTALVITGYGRLIYGDGPEMSVLNITSTNDALTCTQSLLRVTLRNFSITGDASSGCGVYFDQTASLSEHTYCSQFENLYIYTGDQAILIPGAFSCTFTNVYGSSHSENVFEIWGGTSTTMIGCYAQTVPAGKYGYRIYSQAVLIGCNGIDSPGNVGARWGLFGQNTSPPALDGGAQTADAVQSQYYITMVGCGIEDFNDYGLHFRFDGAAVITNCYFLAKTSGTYKNAVLIEYCDRLIDFQNCTFGTKGATRDGTRDSYVYSINAAYVIGSGNSFDQVYNETNGAKVNGGAITYTNPAANEAAHTMRNLAVTRNLYLSGAAAAAGTNVVALGNAVQSTVGAAGGATALPATPTGYLKFYIGTTHYVIPYYAQA